MGQEGNVSGGGRVWWAVGEELTVQWYGWENSLNVCVEAGKFSHLCASCAISTNINCSGWMLIECEWFREYPCDALERMVPGENVKNSSLVTML